MFIARPVAELASSSQQDGKQLNVTQLIGWLNRQPYAGAPRIFLNDISCPIYKVSLSDKHTRIVRKFRFNA